MLLYQIISIAMLAAPTQPKNSIIRQSRRPLSEKPSPLGTVYNLYIHSSLTLVLL